jgi:hypothetical protein
MLTVLFIITTILTIAHVVLTIKWDLKDPVKTNRLMWLAIVIVGLQSISGAWLFNIIVWSSVVVIAGYTTDKNRKRIKAEQEDGKQ